MAIKGKKGIVEFVVEIHGDKAAQEYQKLEDSLKRLKKEQKEFNEGSEDYKKIQTEINKTNKSLKELNPTYEQLTKQKKALERQLKRLTPGTEEFIKKSKEVEEVTKRHAALKTQIDNVSKAQKKAGTEAAKTGGIMSKLKGLNPFGMMLGPIGLLLTALGALFSAFSKSEKGAKLLTKAQGALQAVMSMLVKLTVDLAEKLQWVFENPQEALKEFGQLLLDQILNRIKGAVMAVGSLGKALGRLVVGDMAGAKDAAKEAGEAFLMMTTGLDGEQQKAFAEGVRETVKEVQKQTNSFVKLAMAKRNAGQAAGALAVQLQKLINEEERLNAIADANTLSFKAREQAAEQARVVSEQRARKEIELAKAQLGLLSQEINLRRANGEDVNDMLAAQADARAAVLAAEGNLQQTIFANDEMRRQLMQDRLERDLDIYIDGYDFQKTILERQLQDERLALDEKIRIQDEIERLGEDSFKKQIATIEQFTNQAVDVEELLQAARDGTLQQKIRDLELSEIIEGRQLEIIKERAIALMDFEETRAALEKQAAEERKSLREAEHAEIDDEFEASKNEELARLENEQAWALVYSDNKLQTELEFLQRRSALLEEWGEYDANLEREIVQKRVDLAEWEAEQKQILEERTRAARESAMQQTTAAINGGLDLLINSLSKDEEARKKHAKAIQAFEIAKVGTNLVAEISAIWRNANSNPANVLIPGFGTAIAAVQTGLAVGRAAIAVRNITAQQFATGGKVGQGNIARLPNGDNVLATLQTGEVVLTVPQQIALGGANTFKAIGVPGFSGGGAVGRPSSDVQLQPSASVAQSFGNNDVLLEKLDMLIKETKKQKTNLKASVVYDEFVDKGNEIEGARSGASW